MLNVSSQGCSLRGSRDTARGVSSIWARFRYLADVVGREGDVAVRSDLALFCAVVTVSERSFGSGAEAFCHTLKRERAERG